MDNETLRKLQLTELELLKVFDEFCKKHDIKYSLYAGTALGAVRHGGFIPWDDDIDVCMERPEYERFLRLWREENIDGYYLQGTDSPNYYGISFSKIRKNGTKFGTEMDIKMYDHIGIFLDIFPFDKIPKDKKLRKKFLFDVKLWMLYTRGYPYTKGSKFLEIVSRLLLLKSRKKQIEIRNKLEQRILSYQSMESDYDLICLACPNDLNFVYPSNILDDIIKVDFEGVKVSMHKDFDTALKIKFGDYMQLPKEEDRVCKHEPAVLEF